MAVSIRFEGCRSMATIGLPIVTLGPRSPVPPLATEAAESGSQFFICFTRVVTLLEPDPASASSFANEQHEAEKSEANFHDGNHDGMPFESATI